VALVTIDATEITNPSNIEVGTFRITKSQRTASGLMQSELIATKKKIELQWDMITQVNLKAILDLLDTAVFHSLIYPDAQGVGGLDTITVYIGDIQAGLWHMQGGVRWWNDARIGLVER
jgi:hypothetical protein